MVFNKFLVKSDIKRFNTCEQHQVSTPYYISECGWILCYIRRLCLSSNQFTCYVVFYSKTLVHLKMFGLQLNRGFRAADWIPTNVRNFIQKINQGCKRILSFLSNQFEYYVSNTKQIFLVSHYCFLSFSNFFLKTRFKLLVHRPI